MTEISYSKKQLTPIMTKYRIDEKSPIFIRVCSLFSGQTPYQIWGLKAVLDGKTTIDNIAFIHDWAQNNKTSIHLLSKGNIIAYTTKSDFELLRKEICGINLLNLCKKWIDTFNTRQRDMLRQAIFGDENITPLTAYASIVVKSWAKIFDNMAKLPKHRIEKLIITSSAIDDIEFLKKHISDSFSTTYDWVKEDLIAFVQLNTPDCKIVFDNGPIVVVEVNSFKSSKALCGNGRTSWCLTRDASYFNQYVTSKNAHQYFFFDFSKKENHDLAHIGFTVRDGQGITNAHSTRNNSLINEINVDNKRVDIHSALQMAGVPSSVYIKLKELVNFQWNIESFLEFISKNSEAISLCFEENNRVMVRLLNSFAINKVLGHTLISLDGLSLTNGNKVYAMLDFTNDVNDNNSTIVCQFNQDKYKTDSFVFGYSGYNKRFNNLDYLTKLGITTDRYLNREKIDPKILLHKYIEERNEASAVKLINQDNVDVNYEFNDNIPVFLAAEFALANVFKAIVNSPTFDSSVTDGLGESLLTSLMYEYSDMPESRDAVKVMITEILNSKHYDRNVVNINYDTAINIACSRLDLLWVVEELIKDPNVNLNVVNDINCTALGEALRIKNLAALKLLGQRPDLVVRAEDETKAAENGIRLADYIKPQPMPNAIHTELVALPDGVVNFEEIMASC